MTNHVGRVGEHGLTPKQDRMYNLLLTNATYKQLRGVLGIKTSTLTFHVNNIFNVLGFKSRAELVVDHYELHGVVNVKFDWNLLPKRSWPIINLLLKGYTVNETAELLECSIAKVNQQRHMVFKITGAENALDLIFKYYGVEKYTCDKNSLEASI